jgi:hypothetical protein
MPSYTQHTKALEDMRSAQQVFAQHKIFRHYRIWREMGPEQRARAQANSRYPPIVEGSVRLVLRSDDARDQGVVLELEQHAPLPDNATMLEQVIPLTAMVVEKVWKRWLAGELQELPPDTQEAEETRKMLEELPND